MTDYRKQPQFARTHTLLLTYHLHCLSHWRDWLCSLCAWWRWKINTNVFSCWEVFLICYWCGYENCVHLCITMHLAAGGQQRSEVTDALAPGTMLWCSHDLRCWSSWGALNSVPTYTHQDLVTFCPQTLSGPFQSCHRQTSRFQSWEISPYKFHSVGSHLQWIHPCRLLLPCQRLWRPSHWHKVWVCNALEAVELARGINTFCVNTVMKTLLTKTAYSFCSC